MRNYLKWILLVGLVVIIGGVILVIRLAQQPADMRRGGNDPANISQNDSSSPQSNDASDDSSTPNQDSGNSSSAGGTKNKSGNSGDNSSGGGSGGGSGSGGGGSPQEGCPPLPAYPDEQCTGYDHTDVILTTITPSTPVDGAYFDPDGNLNVTEDGKVIDGIRFDGCIFVRANNVTIKRSLLTRGWCAEGTISAQLGNYTNITIEDVEIDGQNEDPGFSGISGNNFTCTRCNIHNVGTPIRAAANVVVTDSYLHDNSFGGVSHNTGMSMHEGGNVIVRHSNIRCNAGGNCTGAFEINSRDSYVNTGVVIDNVLLENNLFYTDTGYCIYGGWDNYSGTPTHATNIHILNNAFEYTGSTCGDLGVLANWAPTLSEATAAGNIWSDNFVYPNTGNFVNAY